MEQSFSTPDVTSGLDELDESLLSMTQAIDSYKKVLRATECVLCSFLTPMQRAVSICKVANAKKVAHIQQAELERLYDLLPHGIKTHLDIDVYQLLARGKSKQWRLPIPATLASTVTGAVLLSCTQNDQVDAAKFASDAAALAAFQSELQTRLVPEKSQFPRFTHRSVRSMTTFHHDFQAATALWERDNSCFQMLQEYVCPPSTSVAILKAHWKKGQKQVTYYIVTNRKARTKSELPCLVKRLAECYDPAEESLNVLRRNCSVSVKSAAESWAVRSMKQIPDVNVALIEVRRLLETTYLQPRQRVSELVCDFVSDYRRKWVFLKCRGCAFDPAVKQHSQNYEHHKKIDMNFILFPVIDQPQVIRERLRAASQSSELSSLERKIKIFAPKKRGKEELQKIDWKKLQRGLGRRHESEATFHTALQQYDSAMVNMLKYKLGQQTSTNFLEKYGGIGCWHDPLNALCKSLYSKAIREPSNFEESEMMVKGFSRVLCGSYMPQDKPTLANIHRKMEVTKAEFALFLGQLETALQKVQVTPQDAIIILARFRLFESCICLANV